MKFELKLQLKSKTQNDFRTSNLYFWNPGKFNFWNCVKISGNA